MSTPVSIAGVGMTTFGSFPDATVRSLAEEAVAEALADAGLGPRDVDLVVFANAVGGLLSGQEMIRGQAALRHTGLLGAPILNVENACASASTALHVGSLAIRADEADVVLVVGAEKLTHPQRQVSLDAIATAVDLEGLDELDAELRAAGADPTRQGGPASRFMAIYASVAVDYLRRTDATPADFAATVVKNSRHGLLNPKAQYGGEVTIDEVLASRVIVPPLTLRMCCPVSDGAAAVVLTGPGVKRTGSAPVQVLATTLASSSNRADAPAVTRAAFAAYRKAGIAPSDLDVVEIHDAAASAEMIVYEELGLCGPGEGPALLRSGATALGGDTVVNPSGGLLCRGHPIGATGCAQVVELTEHLRGNCGDRQVRGARLALAENGGGYLGGDVAAASITVLASDG
jgi:acetyl-CoA acetyltransferase